MIIDIVIIYDLIFIIGGNSNSFFLAHTDCRKNNLAVKG